MSFYFEIFLRRLTTHGFIRWMSFLAAYDKSKFWDILHANEFFDDDFIVIERPKVIIHDLEGNERVITKKENAKVCSLLCSNK